MEPSDGGSPTAKEVLDRDVANRRPLGRPSLPRFPVETLPCPVAEYVIALARDHKVGADLPGALALGILSLAGNHAKIKVRGPLWTDGVNLWIVVAAAPGESKSPILNRLSAPLSDMIEDLEKDWETKHALWEAKQARIDKALKALLEQAKQSADPVVAAEHDQAHVEASDHRRTEPRRPRLWIGNTTPEAMVSPLQGGEGRLAIMDSEGSMFTAMSQYVDRGRAAAVETYLQGFSGERVIIDRVSREEPVIIPEARIVMVLTTQPGHLGDILSDANNQARGFSDRFLVCEPESQVGHRDFRDMNPVPEHIREGYSDWLQAFWNRTHADADPLEVTVPSESYTMIQDFQNEIERKPADDLERLGTFPTKLVQSTLRTAGLLHVAWDRDVDEWGVSVGDAVALARYWLAHIDAFSQPLRVSDAAAKRSLRWATMHGKASFTVRDIQRSGVLSKLGYKTSDQIHRLFEAMEEDGSGHLDHKTFSVRFGK